MTIRDKALRISVMIPPCLGSDVRDKTLTPARPEAQEFSGLGCL